MEVDRILFPVFPHLSIFKFSDFNFSNPYLSSNNSRGKNSKRVATKTFRKVTGKTKEKVDTQEEQTGNNDIEGDGNEVGRNTSSSDCYNVKQ